MNTFFTAAAVISHLIISVPGISECSERYLHYQQHDSSCGFAAVAALMDCWWDTETDEASLIDDYFSEEKEHSGDSRGGSNSGVYTIAFSDMQSILADYGFISAGFQLDRDSAHTCLEEYGPIIIHEDIENGHFSVLIDIIYPSSGKPIAVLADPNTGIEFYSWSILCSGWNGSALIAADSEAVLSSRLQGYQQTLRKELKTQYESFKFFTERYSPSQLGL